MTYDEIVASFIHMAPIIFLTHAIENYTERVKQARSIKEEVFLETTLQGLKEAMKIYLN